MAEALVTTVLEKSFSVVYEYTKDAVTLVLNAKNDVQKFNRHLRVIQDVLEDAEKKQVKEASVRHWLNQLKDVSYEMDDVLDEWNTEILKLQVEERRENQGQNAVVTKRKVCFSIPSSCFCFGQVNKAIYHYKIATKIKDLNEKLSSIAEERKQHSFHLSLVRPTDEQLNDEKRKTSSFVDTSMIVGRKDEEDNLLSMLSSKSSQEGEKVLIIPIVGMGGAGKTTLAKSAYNTETVHFDTKIWVCVSDPFNVIEIAKNIISRTGNGMPNSNELEDVLQCMSKSIEGKKCLIVLDDVWTEDEKKWENLSLPIIMQKCAHGSRILVTTRKVGVAQMMRATAHMIHLGGLSDQNSLLLFNSIAFLGREEDKSKGFIPIGEGIVRKCNGLPLALKSLASLVQYKKNISEWQDVLDSKIWDLEKLEVEVFQPLLLSYYDLIPLVKRCFLYCATFPKDYRFDRDNLIELWMSQDYLNMKGHKEKKAIGEEIFNNLVMRSFFQDLVEDKISISCKMHDIVHDLVQFLGKNEGFVTEAEGEEAEGDDTGIEVGSESVRHLALMFARDNPLSSFLSSPNCKKLRTLATFYSRITCIESRDISQLKCVRTLILSSNDDIEELPEEMGELIHLRYVDLSKNRSLKKLPDSLCKLYNLQTLRLVGCEGLRELPENMGSLVRLRHLHIKDSGLRYLPRSMGRLTSLQRLVVDVCFVYGSDPTCPSWIMSLENLRFLSLASCDECEYLPPLGKLPFLEELFIKKMPKVRCVGDEFSGIAGTSHQSSSSCILFPKLKTLSFEHMRAWEQWEGVGGLEENSSEITIMPRLLSLEIADCKELTNLPVFLRNRPAVKISLDECTSMRTCNFPADCDIIMTADEDYCPRDMNMLLGCPDDAPPNSRERRFRGNVEISNCLYSRFLGSLLDSWYLDPSAEQEEY